MGNNSKDYGLQEFVSDLRVITRENDDEKVVMEKVKPLAKKVAMDKRWVRPEFYEIEPGSYFRSNLLHVEDDHSLFIVAVSWIQHQGAPAHDHGTWAVVVGVDGPEQNTFWRRVDDGKKAGYAELEFAGEMTLEEGDVLTIPTGVIHGVHNPSDQVALSFHVYGKHLNHTGRSKFYPEQRIEEPFVIETR